MKLVDVNEVQKKIRSYFHNEIDKGKDIDVLGYSVDLCRAVNDIKNYYDVEDVIDNLEDERDFANADFEEYVNENIIPFDSEYDDNFSCGLGRAIDVVKRGWKYES